MANSELWVGVLTAMTALGASYLTARGTSRAALAQARTTTMSDALREERERRRSTYRQMMTCVHAFSEVCWQLLDTDATQDRESRHELLTQMHQRMGWTLSDMTRATREVLLDGPAEVASAAEEVRTTALRVQTLLRALIGDNSSERRHDYDEAYQSFRDAYVAFIGLARQALEAKREAR
ncbi:MAG: hypothetical protein AUI14_18675 [Actinobacteria bacterium 13_2_20CM_2_71_6]|nr:MAG: hypothetical protein AUI14_18675 [Actinobacteria bacterium 13_2_20CM_2_71_6]